MFINGSSTVNHLDMDASLDFERAFFYRFLLSGVGSLCKIVCSI